MIPARSAESAATPGTVADLLALTKPRIASFVALAATVAGLLASGPGTGLGPALEAAFWITCAAASASVFNQAFEKDVDARMARTAGRPVAAGRISVRDAILFGTALATAAVLGLALRHNLLSALLALATIFVYAGVYTPLKRVSTLNTVVGALPGAAPPLLAWAAITGEISGWAWPLFAIVFAWQFPHFMAIAWLHRADYARAGIRMLPCLPGGESMAGRAALAYGLVLLPIAILPGAQGDAGWTYTAGALSLTLAYVAASARFAWRPDERSARALLLTSLAYLPLLLCLILFDPAVGAGTLRG